MLFRYGYIVIRHDNCFSVSKPLVYSPENIHEGFLFPPPHFGLAFPQKQIGKLVDISFLFKIIKYITTIISLLPSALLLVNI